MPTFDSTNLRVILDTGVTSYNADIDIYLPWKNYLLADSANFGVPPVFDTVVGGDTVDAVVGESIDRQLFFRNDLGWRIRPPEEDIEITIIGDLNPRDSSIAMFVPTLGGFSTQIRQRVSSKARILETGVSGLTAQEAADLLLTRELHEADHFFDKSAGLLHYYRRGTTIDLVPPKQVSGETALGDVTIDQP